MVTQLRRCSRWPGATLGWLTAWVLAFVLPVRPAAPASGPERLQRLARLPQLSFSLGLAFTANGGFELLGDAQDSPRTLQALRNELTGGPADAPRYVKLGRVLASLNEGDLAQRAYAQAAQMFEQQGAAESRDPAVLTGWAEALLEQGKADQAERMLRRAVEVAPTNWLAHASLARFLARSALRSAAGPSGPAEAFFSPTWVRPDATVVEQARRQMDEARAAADRAVALGSQQAAAFSNRAAVGSIGRILALLTGRGDGAPGDAARRTIETNRAIFDREALPDLWAAARLTPDTPQPWGCAAMCELLAEAFQRGLEQADALLTGEFWPLMPEATQQRVREAISRLGAIGESSQPVSAATALTLLGTLQFFVLRDTAGGEASLRRATAVDPTFAGGWEALTFGLVLSKRYETLLEVCQARVKHDDNLRSRVLLAKAYEKNRQPDAMVAELELARQRNPEALLANLALGAAYVMTADDESERSRALPLLSRATQLAGESPPRELAVEVAFQRGLYFALSGQAGVARSHFRRMLELDPQNAEAAEALQALDRAGESE